jgi:hypothetical protein
MSNSDAITPLQDTLFATITGDVALAAKLGGQKVYSMSVPESDATVFAGGKRAYIVLGQSTETPQDDFDGGGDNGYETITVWSNDRTKFTVAEIVADLKRLFHNTDLTVAGRVLVTGRLFVVFLGPSSDAKYSMATLRYEVLTYGA